MAFERSSPLARSTKERGEVPEIPRGRMSVIAPGHAIDQPVTFHLASGNFVLTYHNARVVAAGGGVDDIAVEVTPDTTVTWERLRG